MEAVALEAVADRRSPETAGAAARRVWVEMTDDEAGLTVRVSDTDRG